MTISPYMKVRREQGNRRISQRVDPAKLVGREANPTPLSRRPRPRACEGGVTPVAEGFSMSVTISATAIRYVAWFVTNMTVLAMCWFAPDAAVLATTLKAICEAIKLPK